MAKLIERDYDKLMQFIIIGDIRVGKTAICRQFVNAEGIGEELNATIGIDLNLKVVKTRGIRVKLQIWDTAGQERFDQLTSRYYSRAEAVIIVYDITRENTFKNVHNWLRHVRTRCRDSVSITLVGNKIDLDGKRRVLRSSAKKLAELEKVKFLETSAIANENINTLFYTLTNSVVDKYIPPSITLATHGDEKICEY